jgi:antitoxin ParD1/3/4
MTSMNVSLPESMKQFVEQQVSKGAYGTASEYLRSLIREAQAKAARQELEAELLAGLDSPAGPMTAGDWAMLRRRIIERSPELADE